MGLYCCLKCGSDNIKPIQDFFKEESSVAQENRTPKEEQNNSPSVYDMNLDELIEKSIKNLFPKPGRQSNATWFVELLVLLIPLCIGYYLSSWTYGIGLFVLFYGVAYKPCRAMRSKQESLISDWENTTQQSFLCKTCNTVFNPTTGTSKEIDEMLRVAQK